MNQTTPQSAPQVMDPDQAYGVVYQNVYAPAFFEKLASDYSITPQNDREAMDMLTMASQLRQAHDANIEKQAAAGTDRMGQAKQHLNSQLAGMGLAPQQDTQIQQLIKQAAHRGASDPNLAHAILSMQVAGQQS